MNDKECIVCDMLRELVPERDWLYLGEVEHARIAKMVDAVTTDLRIENAKLREIVRDMRKAFFTLDIDHCQACPRDTINGPCTKYLINGSDECNFEEEMRRFEIEVDGR